MKVIFAVLACFVAASQADVSCDDCITFGTAMQGYLMSDASVAEQTEILVAVLCPQADNPEECDAGIRMYWPNFALAMYPVFLEANDVCSQLGACKVKRTFVKEPTCEDCTGGVDGVAGVIESDGKIGEIMDFLKGDGYCAGSGDDNCGMVVDALMPYAMPVLAGVLRERAAQFCCELSTGGICC